MNPSSNPAITAAIIAGAVALAIGVLSQIIAVVNQVLTHTLTQRRETQKYYNEVYQKLFAPIISDVFLYADIMTNFRKGHDTPEGQESEIKDKIINFISQNVVHLSPILLSNYHQIIRHRIWDETGFDPNEHELRLLLSFVEEYENVIRKSSIYTGVNQKIQIESFIFYRFLYLLWLNKFLDIAMYHWRFTKSSVTDKNYRRIKFFCKQFKNNEQRLENIYIQEQGKQLKNIVSMTNQEELDKYNTYTQEQYEKRQLEYEQRWAKHRNQIGAILVKDSETRKEVLAGD